MTARLVLGVIITAAAGLIASRLPRLQSLAAMAVIIGVTAWFNL